MKRRRIIFISSLVVLLVAIVIGLVAFFNSTSLLSDYFAPLRGKTILTINRHKIYESDFNFFCALVLEDEDLIYYYQDYSDFDDIIKEEAKNFISEYIYRLSEAKAKGYSLTKAEKAGIKENIDDQYKAYAEGTDIKSEREFYDFFYGISKKQFTEFRYNWAIIDKYNIDEEKNADTSLEMQEKAYDTYKDFLYSKKTMILVRYLDELDADKIEEERALIDKLYNDIIDGDDMLSLIKGYGQDEDVIKAEGFIQINASYADVFPELYEWSKEAKIGDLDIVSSDLALFIVKCTDVIDYEKLKDTDELKEWAKFYFVNKNIEELMASGKYKIKVHEKNYKNLDISDLTKESLDYFKSRWG